MPLALSNVLINKPAGFFIVSVPIKDLLLPVNESISILLAINVISSINSSYLFIAYTILASFLLLFSQLFVIRLLLKQVLYNKIY